jgi:hypothetical protein
MKSFQKLLMGVCVLGASVVANAAEFSIPNPPIFRGDLACEYLRYAAVCGDGSGVGVARDIARALANNGVEGGFHARGGHPLRNIARMAFDCNGALCEHAKRCLLWLSDDGATTCCLNVPWLDYTAYLLYSGRQTFDALVAELDEAARFVRNELAARLLYVAASPMSESLPVEVVMAAAKSERREDLAQLYEIADTFFTSALREIVQRAENMRPLQEEVTLWEGRTLRLQQQNDAERQRTAYDAIGGDGGFSRVALGTGRLWLLTDVVERAGMRGGFESSRMLEIGVNALADVWLDLTQNGASPAASGFSSLYDFVANIVDTLLGPTHPNAASITRGLAARAATVAQRMTRRSFGEVVSGLFGWKRRKASAPVSCYRVYSHGGELVFGGKVQLEDSQVVQLPATEDPLIVSARFRDLDEAFEQRCAERREAERRARRDYTLLVEDYRWPAYYRRGFNHRDAILELARGAAAFG